MYTEHTAATSFKAMNQVPELSSWICTFPKPQLQDDEGWRQGRNSGNLTRSVLLLQGWLACIAHAECGEGALGLYDAGQQGYSTCSGGR